jgi:hypothetical protein
MGKLVLYNKIYSFFLLLPQLQPSCSYLAYMTLATLEIGCPASICNHYDGFPLLGLHGVEYAYAGRPVGNTVQGWCE